VISVSFLQVSQDAEKGCCAELGNHFVGIDGKYAQSTGGACTDCEKNSTSRMVCSAQRVSGPCRGRQGDVSRVGRQCGSRIHVARWPGLVRLPSRWPVIFLALFVMRGCELILALSGLDHLGKSYNANNIIPLNRVTAHELARTIGRARDVMKETSFRPAATKAADNNGAARHKHHKHPQPQNGGPSSQQRRAGQWAEARRFCGAGSAAPAASAASHPASGARLAEDAPNALQKLADLALSLEAAEEAGAAGQRGPNRPERSLLGRSMPFPGTSVATCRIPTRVDSQALGGRAAAARNLGCAAAAPSGGATAFRTFAHFGESVGSPSMLTRVSDESAAEALHRGEQTAGRAVSSGGLFVAPDLAPTMPAVLRPQSIRPLDELVRQRREIAVFLIVFRAS